METHNAVVSVIKDFSVEVETYQKGKEGVLNFLVGQVQKILRGKGDPKKVADELSREMKSN
jgi:Asp-tRNA(Asn)/Glu-tRNA(Gln) amidotransferase B subunit